MHELGIELPPPFAPAGNYLACVIDGGLVHLGGHGAIGGDVMVRGKVGSDLTLGEGQRAAAGPGSRSSRRSAPNSAVSTRSSE